MNHFSNYMQMSETPEYLIKQISPSKLNTLAKAKRLENREPTMKKGRKFQEKEIRLSNGIDTELSNIRNEKFHLELELEQKNQEISRLKSMLLPKLTPPAIDLKDAISTFHPRIEKELHIQGYGDFATHFSSSSYEGQREDTTETSTVATTTASQKQREHKIFTQDILPFIKDTLDIYRCSHIFAEEIDPIKDEFEAFFDKTINKEDRCRIFSSILSNMIRIQRLMVAALNRELELKKIDRKMSYLAALFAEPDEHNLPKHQYLEEIKKQMLDVILSIYGEVPKIKDRKEHINTRKEHKKNESMFPTPTEPELVPIGYTNEKKNSDRKKYRNIKLTPFKSVTQEKSNDGPDLSDPLQVLLTERLNLSSLEDSTSHGSIKFV